MSNVMHYHDVIFMRKADVKTKQLNLDYAKKTQIII